MSGPSITLEAFVLAVHPPSESFARLTLYGVEPGTLTAFHRVPRKASAKPGAIDLFDRVQLVLDPAPQGDAWFVREASVLARVPGIAQSYEHLLLASAFAQGVARNLVPAESRQRVWQLLDQALQAFGRSPRADIVYFKSLFAFIREEGYPVRQQWMASLPRADQDDVAELLRRPLAEQECPPPRVRLLLRRLEAYLRAETEFVVPSTEGL